MFLRPCSPGDYHKNRFRANFGFKLMNHQGAKAPLPLFTNDAFPGLFDWADGNYEFNGKKVPHFETWSDLTKPSLPASSPRPAYVPVKVSYEDGSPLKKRRAQDSGAGDAKSRSSDFTLEDE